MRRRWLRRLDCARVMVLLAATLSESVSDASECSLLARWARLPRPDRRWSMVRVALVLVNRGCVYLVW